MNILLVVAAVCIMIAVLRYVWYGVLFLIFGGSPVFNKFVKYVKTEWKE